MRSLQVRFKREIDYAGQKNAGFSGRWADNDCRCQKKGLFSGREMI